MDATLYRKNWKHWGEPPAVFPPAKSTDVMIGRIPPLQGAVTRTTPAKTNISPALKSEEMKGGRV
jgi:hypothetical protein